jgi:hypothetical protein
MRLPSGYIKILDKNHPNTDYNGYVFEHVLVMSKHLKRSLDKSERVHHKDGNRSNNRLSNLELWRTEHPYGQRVDDLVNFAWKIINKYDPQHSGKLSTQKPPCHKNNPGELFLRGCLTT